MCSVYGANLQVGCPASFELNWRSGANQAPLALHLPAWCLWGAVRASDARAETEDAGRSLANGSRLVGEQAQSQGQIKA